MDPRHTDAEDEQFLLNMIVKGQGDVPEHADNGINTDIYLNISGDGIELGKFDKELKIKTDFAVRTWMIRCTIH